MEPRIPELIKPKDMMKLPVTQIASARCWCKKQKVLLPPPEHRLQVQKNLFLCRK
jgi:hypothetical protein